MQHVWEIVTVLESFTDWPKWDEMPKTQTTTHITVQMIQQMLLLIAEMMMYHGPTTSQYHGQDIITYQPQRIITVNVTSLIFIVSWLTHRRIDSYRKSKHLILQLVFRFFINFSAVSWSTGIDWIIPWTFKLCRLNALPFLPVLVLTFHHNAFVHIKFFKDLTKSKCHKPRPWLSYWSQIFSGWWYLLMVRSV